MILRGWRQLYDHGEQHNPRAKPGTLALKAPLPTQAHCSQPLLAAIILLQPGQKVQRPLSMLESNILNRGQVTLTSLPALTSSEPLAPRPSSRR